MGEIGGEKLRSRPGPNESSETTQGQPNPEPMIPSAELNDLSPEQGRVVERLVADIKQEGHDYAFVEVMDDADIDALAARYFEKGVELDSAVKRSLRNAVRRALGLPERGE